MNLYSYTPLELGAERRPGRGEVSLWSVSERLMLTDTQGEWLQYLPARGGSPQFYIQPDTALDRKPAANTGFTWIHTHTFSHTLFGIWTGLRLVSAK